MHPSEPARIGFDLAPGLPTGLLRAYQRTRVAADRLKPLIQSGQAAQAQRRHYAQLCAVAQLIEQNRYWYVGPTQLRPTLPPRDPAVGFLQCPIDSDNVAVFELLQSEFPGTRQESRQDLAATAQERRQAAVDQAKKDAHK